MKTAHRALTMCSACEAQGFASTPCKYGCHEITFVTDPPARDHACDACGGSGAGYMRLRGSGPRFFTQGPALCTDLGPVICPVCRGSGRISDVMGYRDKANGRLVLDALADALSFETAVYSLPWPLDNGLHDEMFEATHARYLLVEAPWESRSDRDYLDRHAIDAGITSARAAFRAVPGLRESYEHASSCSSLDPSAFFQAACDCGAVPGLRAEEKS